MPLAEVQRVVGWAKLLLEATATFGVVRSCFVVIVVADDIEHREAERLQRCDIVVEQRHMLVYDIAKHQAIDIAVCYCRRLLAHIAVEVVADIERVVGYSVVRRRLWTRLWISANK